MKNRHRIFIAINLDNGLKKTLAKYATSWPELPARWTKTENLHITLEFLGQLDSQEVADLSRILNEIAKDHQMFSLNFKKIAYSDQKFPPRMVWAFADDSEELINLKNDILKNIGAMEQNKFTPHITLARIKKWGFKNMEREEIPIIDEDIDFIANVTSIEIMESILKKGGPEYIVLESILLQ